MLYVFHVDTGTMMTFEMNLALGSVEQLKESIEKVCRIPVEKQVLLVSGGECLDPAARVCSYSSGTDTNPIYLFSKSALENAKPPSPNFDYGSDSDIKELFDASLDMPAEYNTVVVRAQLAQQFCELARDHTRVCEGLVHDQHLQQQGWAAAVANLEDITSAFKAKSEMFEQSYKQHLDGREENLKILNNFSKDLEILSKIPILPPLMENALSFTEGTRKSDTPTQNETSITQENGSKYEKSEKVSGMTLLMWISAADDQSSLEQMAEQAQRGLDQLDDEVLESLKSEVTAAVDASNTTGMKEIKGLEERLFGLEQLMVETKKIVQEQSDLAQALVQNQNRAGTLNDASILPDLCASHRRQLLVMWQNQHKLCDIRRRCCKAKEELSINLYHRLGWVMFVENLIMNVTNKLMIYHENLKRLRRYIEIIRQVQKAPQVYVAAVSEVVRRKNFSQAFLTWASDMSCRLLAVYNEEFEKRREFQMQFEGHFLQSLFPGFEDNPPAFATQAPAPFDVSLPKLTVRDMEQLKEYLPELEMSISVTKLSAIAQMFLTKSITETKSSDSKENVPVEDRLVAAVSEVGLSSKLDETLLQPSDQEGERTKTVQQKDDKDFESETDTEEFEKVCQSPVENGAPPDSKFEVGPVRDSSPTCSLSRPHPYSNQEFVTTDFYLEDSMPSTYSVSSDGLSHTQVAQFQENLASSKNELEVLRYHLTTASKLANQTANHLKAELNEMKNSSVSDRETILMLVRDIQAHVSAITKGYTDEIEALQIKLNDIVQSGKRETEALEKVIKEKEELLRVVTKDMNKIRSILEDTENEKQGLCESLSTSQQLCQELQMKLEDAVQERMKVVQAVSDKLSSDYKHRIESLEAQLKQVREEREKELMAERQKLSEDADARIAEMESALIRSEVDSEMEREKTISELRERLSIECNEKMDTLRKKLREEAEAEKQRAVKETCEKLAQEYKTEIENLRSRFRLMSAANMEKSPSEASLEKIERLDIIELSNHEAIVFQLKEDAAAEKEAAMKEAVEAERERWKFKLEEELKMGKMRMEEEKQIWLKEAINRAMAEKNSQIETLQTRQDNLTTECQRLRDTVKFLTEGDQIRPGSSPGAGTLDPLVERINILEKEKMELAMELERERNKPVRIVETAESDVLQCPKSGCKDAATSPDPIMHNEACVTDKLARQSTQYGKISITSCSVGDEVLVVWNSLLENYTILQESSTLYLLHPDSLDLLGLRPSSEGLPRKMYCTAQVTVKEYCHAKRSENRFRVPKGTKFYRIKVRPVTRDGKEPIFSKYYYQQQASGFHHGSPSMTAAAAISQSDDLTASVQLIHSRSGGKSGLARSLESAITSTEVTALQENNPGNSSKQSDGDEKKDISTSR